jgi:hypothetical protein
MSHINIHVTIEVALILGFVWLLRKKGSMPVNLWENTIYWKLAIWKFFNGVLKVGLCSFLSGTAAQSWDTLNPGERIVVIISAIISMQTFIDGFLDQTLTKLEGKKDLSSPPPLPTVPNA